MKKLIAWSLPLFLAVSALVGCSLVSKSGPDPEVFKNKVTAFEVDEHTIQLVGPISRHTMGPELKRIQKAPADKPLYVVIQSGGGDIAMVQELVDALASKDTICYARGVASTGFTLFSACKVRLVSKESVAIPTRIVGTFTQVNSEDAQQFTNELMAYEAAYSGLEAKAVGMSLSGYLKRLGNDGYVELDSGEKMLEFGAADGLATVDCTKVKYGRISREIDLPGMIGLPDGASLTVVLSACPMPRQLVSPDLPPEAISFFDLIVDSLEVKTESRSSREL